MAKGGGEAKGGVLSHLEGGEIGVQTKKRAKKQLPAGTAVQLINASNALSMLAHFV
jgi:hypothetical protein